MCTRPGDALPLTNRFHGAMRLFSNGTQITSKDGKNKNLSHEHRRSVSLISYGNCCEDFQGIFKKPRTLSVTVSLLSIRVVIIIFIAFNFKMIIMIIGDVQGNIYLELSNLERDMRGGGGRGKVLKSTKK